MRTLTSRLIDLEVSPADSVMDVKLRLQDQEGVSVESQELRRVTSSGATETARGIRPAAGRLACPL